MSSSSVLFWQLSGFPLCVVLPTIGTCISSLKSFWLPIDCVSPFGISRLCCDCELWIESHDSLLTPNSWLCVLPSTPFWTSDDRFGDFEGDDEIGDECNNLHGDDTVAVLEGINLHENGELVDVEGLPGDNLEITGDDCGDLKGDGGTAVNI